MVLHIYYEIPFFVIFFKLKIQLIQVSDGLFWKNMNKELPFFPARYFSRKLHVELFWYTYIFSAIFLLSPIFLSLTNLKFSEVIAS